MGLKQVVAVRKELKAVRTELRRFSTLLDETGSPYIREFYLRPSVRDALERLPQNAQVARLRETENRVLKKPKFPVAQFGLTGFVASYIAGYSVYRAYFSETWQRSSLATDIIGLVSILAVTGLLVAGISLVHDIFGQMRVQAKRLREFLDSLEPLAGELKKQCCPNEEPS